VRAQNSSRRKLFDRCRWRNISVPCGSKNCEPKHAVFQGQNPEIVATVTLQQNLEGRAFMLNESSF
jgi:hypothetical protein